MTLPPADLDPRPRLLIVGCSTRAAAWSAVRAGFRPVCADQFGDEDLRQVAEVVPMESLLDSKAVFLPSMCADGWMYLGGMENHPQQLRVFCGSNWRFGQCLGTDPKHLATLRSPELLQTAADAAGIMPLEIRHAPGTQADDRLWLRKHFHSGGGLNVRFERSEAHPTDTLADGEYLQEFSAGRPLSVVFVVSRTVTKLLGFTEQLIGCKMSAAPSPFTYCGNIGPISLTRSAGEQLRSVATSLGRAGLRGLCGIDFLWEGTSLRIVELNPRYTASCELVELALQRPLLIDHCRCFPALEVMPAEIPSPTRPVRHVFGKLILYARRAVIAPDLLRFVRPRSPWSVPFLADVPRIGTSFEPGQPLCTVFATGGDAETVRLKLERRAARVRQWFGDETQPGAPATAASCD